MSTSLTRTAASATLHCLLGCSIGEIIGMVLTTALALSAVPSIVISVVLAFIFGYGLSMRPLLQHGLHPKQAARLALASDSASIATMELVDNAFVLLVPGAINAGLATVLFWWSLTVSLVLAFAAAFPLNRWLIARGKGHAIVHQYHNHHEGELPHAHH